MTPGGEGELVSVAYASDRVEAGMIRGLLDGVGIPSAEQQLGIDGPTVGVELLNPGGGGRRILVRASHAEAARTLLAEVLVEGEYDDLEALEAEELTAGKGRGARNYNLISGYARAVFWSVAAMGLAFGIFLLLRLV